MKHEDLIPAQSSFSFDVCDAYANMRLDQFIADKFPAYSRSFFTKLIKSKHITVNSKSVAKSGVRLRVQDTIAITFPKQVVGDPNRLKKENIDVKVVHEHDQFLIISKPVGLVVHSPSSHSTIVTLVDWIVAHYESISKVGYVDRPGIVHRLDKNTSGLLVIPRTNNAHGLFSEFFKERTISKKYRAFVHGHPSQSGVIELLIGRDPINKTKMIALAPEDSRAESINKLRESTTHYEVVEYFDDYTLVDIDLLTGRTHQIRAHFSAIGHPLLGDTVYGGKATLIKRQALHAHTLEFTFEGKKFSFKTPMPEDMQQLLKLPA